MVSIRQIEYTICHTICEPNELRRMKYAISHTIVRYVEIVTHTHKTTRQRTRVQTLCLKNNGGH